MTLVDELARFVARRSYGDLSTEAVEALKVRVLDSLGCAVGALGGGPIRMARAHIEDFGGSPRCTLRLAEAESPREARFSRASAKKFQV